MYKINEDIVFESSNDNEVLMYNTANKDSIILNHSAKLLIDCCVGVDVTQGFAWFLAKVKETYIGAIDMEQVEADAKETFDILIENKILV